MKRVMFLKICILFVFSLCLSPTNAQYYNTAISDTLWRKEGGAYLLCFSPDGKYLACNSVIGAVILRDAFTGNAVDTLKGFDRILDFSPDNIKIATIPDTQSVTLWNYHDNSLVKKLTVDGTPFFSAALFTKNGDIVVATYATELHSLNQKQYICAWEVATGKLLWNKQQGWRAPGLGNDEWGTKVLSVSTDGKFVAYRTERYRGSSLVDLIIRDGATGEVIKSIPIDNNAFESPIKLSPDGRFLAISKDTQTTVVILSTDTWNPVQLLRGGNDNTINYGSVFDIIFTPKSGFIIVSGSYYSKDIAFGPVLRAWNIDTGKNVFTYYPVGGHLAISPDSAYLAQSNGKSTSIIHSLNWTTTDIQAFKNENQFSLKTFKTNSSHFTISFTLVKESHAIFSLFDMEGKLVKVLKEGMFDAGEQSFIWDSGSMPQGAYLLQLTADGQAQTAKILITK